MTYLPCARLTLLRSTITTTNADAMFAKIIKCGGREVPKFESFSVDPSPSPPRSSPSTTPPPLLSPSSPSIIVAIVVAASSPLGESGGGDDGYIHGFWSIGRTCLSWSDGPKPPRPPPPPPGASTPSPRQFGVWAVLVRSARAAGLCPAWHCPGLSGQARVLQYQSGAAARPETVGRPARFTSQSLLLSAAFCFLSEKLRETEDRNGSKKLRETGDRNKPTTEMASKCVALLFPTIQPLRTHLHLHLHLHPNSNSHHHHHHHHRRRRRLAIRAQNSHSPQQQLNLSVLRFTLGKRNKHSLTALLSSN
ncbi:hypothetical protein ACMD2_07831 [Ananas comosus]|uniref:Uncharacterized protein n=1 Tax=Ananas comosus TaxID=4615 RepID=A0A199VPQ3_ANACO|nr:hypothetical protein ACMD2_07831 [Ananas comosus]